MNVNFPSTAIYNPAKKFDRGRFWSRARWPWLNCGSRVTQSTKQRLNCNFCFALWKLLVLLGLNGTDHNKVSLKFLEGIRSFFSSLRNFKTFSSLAYLAINLLFICRDLHSSNFVFVIISIRCSKIFANYGCHYGFENRILFSQGREVFNGRGRFCLYAVSGIINKVNQQNIIQRLKLVPCINAATSLGALGLISVAPLKSGSAKGQIFHCAC